MAARSEPQLASLLLARGTFGPRPGDPDRVLAKGCERWLDEELHPAQIDDSALEKELALYPDLSLTIPELIRKYPRKEGSQERERDLLVQLSHARLLRAVSSERQLQEVMTDFWFNHFNVYARKSRDVLLGLPSYERDAIRPRVFGKFFDLLRAVAEHPAMLRYLDNWINFKEGFSPREEIRSRSGRRRRRSAARKLDREEPRRFGLNENYARELLELHTLGVDGGYRQEDVVAVARAFTGWTVVGPRFAPLLKREEGTFFFTDIGHDAGPKTILGERLRGRGIEEGTEVLERLSRHPATARFLSAKLARRFIAEEPPVELVRDMAKTYLATGGDLRAVVRAMFLAPQSAEAARKRLRVKTPLVFVTSALRAQASESVPLRLVRSLFDLGMPLYLCQPPTGYDQDSATWLSAGSLLSRLRLVRELGVSGERELALASPDFQRH